MTYPSTAAATAAERARRPGYEHWLRHVASAAGCSQPVRLSGQVHRVNTGTGAVVATRSTAEMPDAVIYKACGNRRASVCPACAEVYRSDAYQLVLAGLTGGKGTPDTVTGHPAAFVTLTAPSFGPVHTQRASKKGQALPCRPRRKGALCQHARPVSCGRVHRDEDPTLGQPLCLDCYDHAGHVVWNGHASELWRRTSIAANRLLRRHARSHGDQARVRLSFGKCAEYQRRGVVHFHALLRLDGADPDDPDAVLPLPAWANVLVLTHLIRTAVETTCFATEPHSLEPDGWDITWGAQLDIRPLRVRGDAPITDHAVAAYLAKYATKGTETTGHVSKRLTADTISAYADDSHVGRLIDAAWTLGTADGFDALRRWAHMLGFGGHFFTKSRRYSTTFGRLRRARVDWRRRRKVRPGESGRTRLQLVDDHDQDTVVVISALTFAGIGWHTTGDALLANTSAAMARERRRAAKDALSLTA
jgi:hypothetical protein